MAPNMDRNTVKLCILCIMMLSKLIWIVLDKNSLSIHFPILNMYAFQNIRAILVLGEYLFHQNDNILQYQRHSKDKNSFILDNSCRS